MAFAMRAARGDGPKRGLLAASWRFAAAACGLAANASNTKHRPTALPASPRHFELEKTICRISRYSSHLLEGRAESVPQDRQADRGRRRWLYDLSARQNRGSRQKALLGLATSHTICDWYPETLKYATAPTDTHSTDPAEGEGVYGEALQCSPSRHTGGGDYQNR